MLGSEGQVLKEIKKMGEADVESIARRMNSTEGYVATICKNLIKDGYLIERSPGLYMITPKTQKQISPVVSRGGVIAVLKGGL